MAKRKTAGETTVTRAAVSIGTALGRAAAKFDEWLEQRDAIARELTSVIGKAQGMLTSIRTPARAAKKSKPTRARKAAKKGVRRTRKAAKKASTK